MHRLMLTGLFQLALATTALASPVYTLQPVSACAACSTLALGINNAGAVVGAAFDAAGAHAFLGSGGTYTVSRIT